MIELKGDFATAKVFTDNIDAETQKQIETLLCQDFVKGAKIRIMPDCHAGAGCVIGFTANLGDKVIPNIVGVDIGCGMLCVELGKAKIDLEDVDKIIYSHIPSGRNAHKKIVYEFEKLKDLLVYNSLKEKSWIEKSVGTLGGGNHFIEVNKDDGDNLYLVIHSGSRNLGKQVAEIYQNIAVELLSGKEEYLKERERVINEYGGSKKKIKKALKELEKKYKGEKPKYPKDLCYLEGEWKDRYLNDMKICQEYARINRKVMADIILDKLFGKKLSDFPHFETIHNYINFNDNIIRKGSVSAYRGEKVLIPINMRDGSLICQGKGNPDWNYSAPHGAGRIMSRNKAREVINLEDYKKSMSGIYTTSVNFDTIDEAPFVYKPMEEIVENIKDTVDIIKVIKPIYNFKAAE